MRVGVAGLGLVLACALAGGAWGQTVIHGTPAGPSAARVIDDGIGTVDMVLRAGGVDTPTRRRHRSGARRRAAAPPIPAEAAGPDAGAAPVMAMRRGAPLDNAQVLMLTRAGLGDAAVAALVQTSAARYDVSTVALIGLRRAGVGSAVIAAMITQQAAAEAGRVEPDSPDPLQPHPPGVYVLADWLDTPRMVPVHAVSSNRTIGGGFLGYAIAGGILPVSYRAVVPGAHAALVAGGRRPMFYFYAGEGVPDPAVLALARFAGKKNAREIGVGSVSVSGARTGVNARDALGFEMRAVAPGVIAVRPEGDLPPGEYGFVQTAAGVGSGTAQAATISTRVFDFAVGDAATAVAADAGPAPRDAGFAHGGVTREVADDALPVAMDYLDRAARAKASKPPLSRAQKAAAAPANYPGGK